MDARAKGDADGDADDKGCWQKKAAYDQCFDQWYKDVFLQGKANGVVGCQDEYNAYTRCFMRELSKDKNVVEGIKSVMSPRFREGWIGQDDAQQSEQQGKSDS